MRTIVLALLATSLVAESSLGAPPGGPVKWKNTVRTAEEDLIKSLPGLNTTAANFRQYSGYLQSFIPGDFSTPEYTHYWLVEAQINAGQAPLLVWLNGGPGTSSLRGLFHENGPFEVAKDGKTLKARKFSWNKLANVLYLESPIPVGFSYTRGREDIYSDRNTMSQVWLALKSFFKKFPQYANNRLYLAGEGYGAAIAFNIAYYQKDFDNLAGFISGNGYLHARYMNKAGVFLAQEHGWINQTDSTWAKLSDYCCDGEKPTSWACEMRGARCARLVSQIYANIKAVFGKNPLNINEDCTKPAANCEDSGPLTVYLNQQEVRDALNIPTGLGGWQMHRELSGYQADIMSDGDGLIPRVKGIMKPLLVYNGDADIICSAKGSEWFADDLGRRVTIGRKPLELANKTVGFVKEYDGLSLVTVSNAGHSVPRDQPQVAFELVKSFLEKTK